MILEGNQRSNGAELARHLLNPRDNDHVTVHSVHGFMTDDLTEALAECEATAQGTRCQQYLYSLSLNPPPSATVTTIEFEAAIAEAERKLGLSGQPRAIVFHEKNGRRHVHCVWSRIDTTKMKAINISHSKRKLMEISIELYRHHGWDMPAGFMNYLSRDPLNYSSVEAAQAKRAALDPQKVKGLFQECWQNADSAKSFAAALWDNGFCLAQGDRRGYVAVDRDGKVWSLSRWCGVKSRDLTVRLDKIALLPTIPEAQNLLRERTDPALNIATLTPPPADTAIREALVQAQRQEREALLAVQDQRRFNECKARNKRIPKGLSGAWARLNGSYARLLADLATEKARCDVRDRTEREKLFDSHLRARRRLARSAQTNDIASHIEAALLEAYRPDPRQQFFRPVEQPPFSVADLLQQPAIVLEYLSRSRARFTTLDVKRTLAEFIVDPLDLRRSIDRALASPELLFLESGECTTTSYLLLEERLRNCLSGIASNKGFEVPITLSNAAIAAQNRQMQKTIGQPLSSEQQLAIRHVLSDLQLSCVVGLAGAGKSTMLKTACYAWRAQGRRVHGTALSGQAAAGLEKAAGMSCRTLASLEHSWKNGFQPVQSGDVLVIDEAGMIGTRQFLRLAEKIETIGAKLVLVGDPAQLQPIEAGRPFAEALEYLDAAKLNEIHRQKKLWQRQASRDLAEGELRLASKAYEVEGSIRRHKDRQMAITALAQDYALDQIASPNIRQLALTHRRVDVFALNQAIRRAIRGDKEIPDEVIVQTDTGPRAIAAGDRIVFGRNDRDIGVRNGTLGTIIEANCEQIIVALDDGAGSSTVQFDPRHYCSFDHGYAISIHRAQGATVDHSYLLASRTLDPSLAYVGMTRHRDNLTLYADEKDRPTWLEKGLSPSKPHQARRRGPQRTL